MDDLRSPRRMGLARLLGLLLVLPIAVALGLYGWLSHENRQRALTAEASAELRNHAALVETAIVGALDRGELELLKQRLARFTRADRILGVACFDAAGHPILVTDQLADATDTLAALSRRVASTSEDAEVSLLVGGAPTLVRAVRVAPGSGAPVVAIVARDIRYLDDLATTLNRGLALTGLALLAATSLLVMLLTRATVGRPAAAIVAGAEAIAGGALGTTVPEQGSDELARLAAAFNAMSRSLSDARTRAEREAEGRAEEENARIRAERKLQHARALAAVGQVAASIAHEIGSPLGVVLGRARLLASRPECPEVFRADLETIATQSERISRVVARMLAAARPPRGLVASVDVTSVAKELVAFLAVECRRRNIAVRIEAGDDPLPAVIDSDSLFQILFNLAWNAVEAQPDGGELVIRIETATTAQSAQRISVTVTDAGPGVPEAIARNIFEPFFTTKLDRAGTGLGLDIVSGIVREVGGSVALLEGPGCGASFRLILPSATGSAAPRVASTTQEAR